MLPLARAESLGHGFPNNSSNDHKMTLIQLHCFKIVKGSQKPHFNYTRFGTG